MTGDHYTFSGDTEGVDWYVSTDATTATTNWTTATGSYSSTVWVTYVDGKIKDISYDPPEEKEKEFITDEDICLD